MLAVDPDLPQGGSFASSGGTPVGGLGYGGEDYPCPPLGTMMVLSADMKRARLSLNC
jgi:hypothetical protein